MYFDRNYFDYRFGTKLYVPKMCRFTEIRNRTKQVVDYIGTAWETVPGS